MSRSRATAYVLIAAALTVFLEREASRGTLDRFERGYLAWLAGNTGRTPGQPDLAILEVSAGPAGDGGGLYDQWPPSALDYATLLENLALVSPASLAIAPVLLWSGDDALSAEILGDKIASFDRAVVACELEAESGPAPAGLPPGVRPMPDGSVVGDPAAVPRYGSVVLTPAPTIAERATAVGFSSIDLGPSPRVHATGEVSVPLVAHGPGGFVPSFALAALASATGHGLGDLTLELGASLTFEGSDTTFPVDPGGAIRIDLSVLGEIPVVPADELFLDSESRELTGANPEPDPEGDGDGSRGAGAGASPPRDPFAALRGSPVLLDLDDPSTGVVAVPGRGKPATAAQLAAALIATVQSGQAPVQLAKHLQWAVWGGVGLVGLLIALCPRWRALGAFAVTASIYAITCILVFGDSAIWWPLAVPATLLATGLAIAVVRDGKGLAGSR